MLENVLSKIHFRGRSRIHSKCTPKCTFRCALKFATRCALMYASKDTLKCVPKCAPNLLRSNMKATEPSKTILPKNECAQKLTSRLTWNGWTSIWMVWFSRSPTSWCCASFPLFWNITDQISSPKLTFFEFSTSFVSSSENLFDINVVIPAENQKYFQLWSMEIGYFWNLCWRKNWVQGHFCFDTFGVQEYVCIFCALDKNALTKECDQ